MEGFKDKKLKIMQRAKLEEINKLIKELTKDGIKLKARNKYLELTDIEDIQFMQSL